MTEPLVWALAAGELRLQDWIPVTDRGLRYGMSVFETLAFFQRRFLFPGQHLDRLLLAAAAAGFGSGAILSVDLLESSLTDRLPGDGLLRIYVTAGDGAPGAPVTEPRAFALFDHTAFPTEPQIRQGFSVITSRAPVPCLLGGWKTGNYWAQIQAWQEAHANQAHEALVYNASGALVSAAMANVFLSIGGILKTPALHCGARDGVLRAWVRQQLPVEETLLTAEDVAMAEECFLTNSRLGVMPVTEIDGRTLTAKIVGLQLARRYHDEVLSR